MQYFARPLLFSLAIVSSPLWQPLVARPQDSARISPGQSSASEMDAEREKIWNSPEMVEARARVELTLQRSAKVTDEQAAQYMADLKAKSPEQMQIWLIQQQELSAQRQQEEARASQLRRQTINQRLPAQNVGRFSNPIAATGRVVDNTASPTGPQGNVQRTQRPFSGPQFSGAAQPLVTSQDMARFEILRGPRPW